MYIYIYIYIYIYNLLNHINMKVTYHYDISSNLYCIYVSILHIHIIHLEVHHHLRRPRRDP